MKAKDDSGELAIPTCAARGPNQGGCRRPATSQRARDVSKQNAIRQLLLVAVPTRAIPLAPVDRRAPQKQTAAQRTAV
jgi:hypothetical protein